MRRNRPKTRPPYYWWAAVVRRRALFYRGETARWYYWRSSSTPRPVRSGAGQTAAPARPPSAAGGGGDTRARPAAATRPRLWGARVRTVCGAAARQAHRSKAGRSRCGEHRIVPGYNVQDGHGSSTNSVISALWHPVTRGLQRTSSRDLRHRNQLAKLSPNPSREFRRSATRAAVSPPAFSRPGRVRPWAAQRTVGGARGPHFGPRALEARLELGCPRRTVR